MSTSIFYRSLCLALVCGLAQAEDSVPFYRDKQNLLVYQDSAGNSHPVKTIADWQRRRRDILSAMQLVMGPLPDRARLPVLDVKVHETVKLDGYERRRISFTTEPGDRALGYLLVPNGAKRLPAVLCCHQTNKAGGAEPVGLAGPDYVYYAKELAERGYVTLAIDYPNFGEYKFDPYTRGYASATMKGIVNHRRAIDLLQSLNEVDPERIGVVGHSLGGHNSLFVAAFDERIKCIVSSCGFCSFPKYYGGDLTGWSHNGYMPRIRERYQRDPKQMPFDFTEVIAALAPRPFLAVAPLHDANFDVDGVKDCIAAARPVYELYGDADRLAAAYPDAEHSFPQAEREQAYAWFDRWLKR